VKSGALTATNTLSIAVEPSAHALRLFPLQFNAIAPVLIAIRGEDDPDGVAVIFEGERLFNIDRVRSNIYEQHDLESFSEKVRTVQSRPAPIPYARPMPWFAGETPFPR